MGYARSYHFGAVELNLLSSGSLRCVKWFETEISELPICPIFKDQIPPRRQLDP